ncbi:hypothetical protein NEF87_001148 [Candidatus Lokiarchaeum ossiferum]|uniref:Uncharacterized protein n=1 Tax=Candidatus Lokiarchaeum ossiferum TaxID=2951803 RepID=A0ABY6HMX8_9ARCH|nr:hypothetical protein NEF87_001148 [Candidatus Lokiarchaeum sp. B-35]
MQRHRYSFFGQKVGLLLDSSEWTDASLYLRFLKKRPEGYWEKPSKKEGKNIKLNLLEMIAILELLSDNQTTSKKWSTVHRFGQEQTPITFEKRNDALTISVPGYQKYMKFPETKLLTDLLQHIYNEKIIYATKSEMVKSTSNPHMEEIKAPSRESIPIQENKIYSNTASTNFFDQKMKSSKLEFNSSTSQDPNAWISTLEQKNDCYLVPGEIQTRSEKAIAFQIAGHKSTWVPLSCISQVIDQDNLKGLWIKQWFINKKVEEIFAN